MADTQLVGEAVVILMLEEATEDRVSRQDLRKSRQSIQTKPKTQTVNHTSELMNPKSLLSDP